MVRSCSLWLSAGFTLLMVMVTLSSVAECMENKLLKEKPNVLDYPSWCVLECTKWTYMKKMLTRDNRTIRFTDSEIDNLGNYCWSMPIKSFIGENVQHAYIVLPVDGSQVEVSLKINLLPHDETLQPQHRPPPLLPNSCGLPFDITAHFSSGQRSPKLCMQIVRQQTTVGNGVLRCPPFLVTMWQ